MDMFRGGRKILIGNEQLDEILKDGNKVFIVCDPFLSQTGKTKYITDRLEKSNIEYEVYTHVVPDPDIDLVTRGVEALLKANPDIIIGFGGGSAIDACKAMIFFASKYTDDKDKISKERTKFIAIPTTSGTGSEVTDFAVITDKEKGIKYPLVDESMLPDIALLDAELTITVPPAITAITGMDVLTHAIEAMVSKNSTDFSDAYAEKAIKLVRSYLLKAYREPNNMEARQGMHNASCLAGTAFNNAGLGLNHGMAHALGGKFHIPHGKANAVLLPYVMGFNAGCFDQITESAISYARIARLIKVDTESVRQSALNLIRSVKKFNADLNMPATIKDLNIPKEDFKAALDDMAIAAHKDNCTLTNPRECSVEDIKRIYIHAYFGAVGRII